MAIRPWLWLAIPGLGALELVMHVLLATKAPTEEEFARVAAQLDRLRKPDDLVVVVPAWSEPLARKAWGEERLSLFVRSRMDVSSYAGAVEVSALDQRAPELASFEEVQRVRAERLLLRRLENPRYVPSLFVFTDQVRPDRMLVGEWNGEAERDCEFVRRKDTDSSANPKFSRGAERRLSEPLPDPQPRFVCTGAKASFVGVTLLAERDMRPRRCILAPAPFNGVLRLRFAQVPIGRVLKGYAARLESAQHVLDGTHVAFSAYVGGQRVGRQAIAAEVGFVPFEFAVQHLQRGSAEVVFEVEGERGAGREFCFNAEMR
ncbi:MAG TPA: hypothetical protein VFQ61_18615 [Polyangiaceae bacterium]|nr:hypothetical protein [Polyangiaceae bacterium]